MFTSSQIKLVNINIPDIIEGKPSIILGLIWTIILHCHVSITMKTPCVFTKTNISYILASFFALSCFFFFIVYFKTFSLYFLRCENCRREKNIKLVMHTGSIQYYRRYFYVREHGLNEFSCSVKSYKTFGLRVKIYKNICHYIKYCSKVGVSLNQQ